MSKPPNKQFCWRYFATLLMAVSLDFDWH